MKMSRSTTSGAEPTRLTQQCFTVSDHADHLKINAHQPSEGREHRQMIVSDENSRTGEHIQVDWRGATQYNTALRAVGIKG